MMELSPVLQPGYTRAADTILGFGLLAAPVSASAGARRRGKPPTKRCALIVKARRW